MNEQTKHAVINSYTDVQKDMIRKFHSDEQFFTFLHKDLIDGISYLNDDVKKFDDNGWMNNLLIDHVIAPKQRGEQPNREEFAFRAEVLAEAIRMIKEMFARYEIVAGEDLSPKKEKKKPTVR